jgi:hypothetical protein
MVERRSWKSTRAGWQSTDRRRVSLGRSRLEKAASRVSHLHRLDVHGFSCRDEIQRPQASRVGDATRSWEPAAKPIGVKGILIMTRLRRKSRHKDPLPTRLKAKSHHGNPSATRRTSAPRDKAHRRVRATHSRVSKGDCCRDHEFGRVKNFDSRFRKTLSRVSEALSRVRKARSRVTNASGRGSEVHGRGSKLLSRVTNSSGDATMG